jgi:hypothetical protein
MNNNEKNVMQALQERMRSQQLLRNIAGVPSTTISLSQVVG